VDKSMSNTARPATKWMLGSFAKSSIEAVQFYAFDPLSDGDDIRSITLSMRKAHLARMRSVGRHQVQRFRAGRDQSGPVPPRLLDGPRRAGLEARQ
jgi:hypothetical protein